MIDYLNDIIRGVTESRAKEEDKLIANLIYKEFGIKSFDEELHVLTPEVKMLPNFYRLHTRTETDTIRLDDSSVEVFTTTHYDFQPVRDEFYVVLSACIFEGYCDGRATFVIDHGSITAPELDRLGMTMEQALEASEVTGGLIMGRIDNEFVPIWEWRQKFKEVTGRESLD